jgi:hypothetical protein
VHDIVTSCVACTLRREQDPVGKILAGAMRLDISSLAAEVAPLSAWRVSLL